MIASANRPFTDLGLDTAHGPNIARDNRQRRLGWVNILFQILDRLPNGPAQAIRVPPFGHGPHRVARPNTILG